MPPPCDAISPAGHEPQRRDLLLLLVLCPALLAGSIAAPFLAYDDRDHVTAPIVTGLAPLSDLLLKPNGSIFPLTALSFRLENLVYHEWLGLAQWAPLARVANLLLHALAGLGLWRLLAALRLKPLAALFVTGAFLLHPLACESVCWVSERKNVLTGACGFWALALLLSFECRWRLPAAAGLFTLALLSKPSALGLLPVFLALLFRPVVARLRPDLARDALPPTPCWPPVLFPILAAALVYFTLLAHGGMALPPPGGSVFTALLTDAEIVRRYMQSAVWPAQLSAFYQVSPILSPWDLRFLANAGLLLAVALLTVWASDRRALSVFLWFWFFAGLGPVMNLVSTSLLMQDRYFYFSAPAFFALLALAAGGLWRRLCGTGVPPASRKHVWLNSGVWTVFIFLAILAAWRSRVWDSQYLLFEDAARKQPRSVLANLCFANTLATLADNLEARPPAGRDARAEVESYRKQAIQHYRQACAAPDLDRLPQPGLLYLNLALAQEKRARLDEAVETLRAATSPRLLPVVSREQIIVARQRLAALLLRLQRPEEALAEAREALALSPQAPRGWLLAGQALEALGRADAAASAYQKVAPGAPEHAAAEERLRALRAAPAP